MVCLPLRASTNALPGTFGHSVWSPMTHTTSEQHWLMHHQALDSPRAASLLAELLALFFSNQALASAGGAALLLCPQLSKNHKTYSLSVVRTHKWELIIHLKIKHEHIVYFFDKVKKFKSKYVLNYRFKSNYKWNNEYLSDMIHSNAAVVRTNHYTERHTFWPYAGHQFLWTRQHLFSICLWLSNAITPS